MKAKTTTVVQTVHGYGTLDRDKARTNATSAMELLRGLANDATFDSSIHEVYVNRLNQELETLEQTLTEILLPPASRRPRLILSDEEEAWWVSIATNVTLSRWRPARDWPSMH